MILAVSRPPVDPPAVEAARQDLVDREAVARLAGLGLLADPTRVQVPFALAAVEELCVGDLALTLGVSEDAAGYALKLLRTAGLVRARKEGRMACYRLAGKFPHVMLEQCLRDLLTVSGPGSGQGRTATP